MTDDTAKETSRIEALVNRLMAEEETRSAGPRWIKYVALLTGVLAGVAGFLTVRETMLTNEAIYTANQAVLAQAQASDSWNEYQADSIKARIVETQIATSGSALDADARGKLEAQAQDFRTRQPKIQQQAQTKEAERDKHLSEGDRLLATRDMIMYADLATQLGIALASVAAMVRVRRAFDAAIAVGGVALLIAAYALGRQWLGVG